MYFLVVILTTIVLPIGSALSDMLYLHGDLPGAHGFVLYLGKWMVFWAGGVRLLLAGLRQTFQPDFTLKQIFGIEHAPSEHIVQELGFANIAMGLTCIFSVMRLELVLAGAIVSGLYYGMAGVKHFTGHGERNAERTLAMVTDMLVAVVLAAFIVISLATGA